MEGEESAHRFPMHLFVSHSCAVSRRESADEKEAKLHSVGVDISSPAMGAGVPYQYNQEPSCQEGLVDGA